MAQVFTFAMIGLLLTLRAAIGQPVAPQPKSMVTVGVRIDTPPFAWRTADGGYSGFLYNLCVDATIRARYPMRTVPIDVTDRNEFMDGKRQDLDLICDPTTITLERMEALRALPAPQPEFSPIIFVANGSYILNPDGESGKLQAADAQQLECLSGAGGNTQEAPGDATVYLAAGFVGETTAEGALRTALGSGALVLKPEERLCLVEKRTHWALAEDFCKGLLRYYFGDEDIMRSTLGMTAERSGGCRESSVSLPLSYEPYGLVVSARQPGFRQDFVMALYGLFHFEPAEGRFQRSFEGQQMSPFLKTLFRTLAIPAGELNTSAMAGNVPASVSE